MSLKSPEVDGVVAVGFEPVADAFAAAISEIGDGGAAFAAVLDGTLVVDLWAGQAGANRWGPETRGVLMSSTKGIVTVAVAQLVERGELDLAAPVASYWPEFAAAGKAEITVAQVLSHAAGVISVPGYETLLEPDGSGWDRTEEIVRRLTAATPRWAPGSAHGYHGVTFGWLIGELVKRVTGRTIGTIVREQIAAPLELELDLGTPADRQCLVAPVVLPAEGAPDPTAFDELWSEMLLVVDGRSLLTEADVFFSDPTILALELAGANATGTARALATLYGTLANGGSRNGVTVLAPETIDMFAAERVNGPDLVLGVPTRWGFGFERPTEPDPSASAFAWGPHDDAFGHDGLGGQLSLADPVDGVGVGFVRSHLSMTSPLGPCLIDALYRCIDRDGGPQDP